MLLRRWLSIKPALVQCFVFARLCSIAADLVLLTAGGDYKPTSTQWLLHVEPASLVLASIHSVLVSTSCYRYQHAGGTGTMFWIKATVCDAGPRSARRQTRHGNPILGYCWLSVVDSGQTLAQNWVNVSCLTSCTIESAEQKYRN